MGTEGRTAYVAGRFSDWRVVRAVQGHLLGAGYALTYDWTVHAEAGENERDGSIAPEAMMHSALTDLRAARDADLLVLVCVDDMADALGCFIEFGAAAAQGADLDVIAPHRPSIFWCLPYAATFDSIETWAARRVG